MTSTEYLLVRACYIDRAYTGGSCTHVCHQYILHSIGVTAPCIRLLTLNTNMIERTKQAHVRSSHRSRSSESSCIRIVLGSTACSAGLCANQWETLSRSTCFDGNNQQHSQLCIHAIEQPQQCAGDLPEKFQFF